MGIFDALSIGYSGLSTAQNGINTTSNNISNVNTPGYSRQRIEQKASYPMDTEPGAVGTGVEVEQVVRLHDEFVYGRYKSANASLSNSEFMESTLQEVSDLFTDLDGKGIANDFQEFFNAWSDLSSYPDDDAAKLVTVNAMDQLAGDLRQTRESIVDVQERLNDELVDSVDQINNLSEQIVELNKQINKIENIPNQNANDLRDERDRLELELAKLVNISVYKGNVDINGNPTQTDAGNAYNINIAGHNIVDGVTFHPLQIAPAHDETPYNAVYFTDHNQNKTDITDKLRGGKLGAIIDLRGDGYDLQNNKAEHSKLQDYIDKLDSLANGLIQKTNSIYASVAQEKIISDDLSEISNESKLSDVDALSTGSFDLVVYDSNGEVVSRRAITIDTDTTLDGENDDNSIVKQINTNLDDNGDNDGTNDLDDLFEAYTVVDAAGTPTLVIEPKTKQGYQIAIEDNGTSFGGWAGVNKLYTGESAKDIRLKSDILNNPASLQASKADVAGSSDLADEMINMQYEKLDFTNPDGTHTQQTLEEYYRYTAADVAEDAQSATRSKDAAELLTKTATEQMQAVSGVDMDEELMNLMKYQTAYQASAKIITTVDQMLNTLLGIKQ